MPDETQSMKLGAWLEILVVLLPVSILASLGAMGVPEFGPIYAITMILAAIALLSAWTLMAIYISRGGCGLRAANPWLFRCAHLGILIVVCSVILVIFNKAGMALEIPSREALMIGFYGLPMVVPYLHLIYEMTSSPAGEGI